MDACIICNVCDVGNICMHVCMYVMYACSYVMHVCMYVRMYVCSVVSCDVCMYVYM